VACVPWWQGESSHFKIKIECPIFAPPHGAKSAILDPSEGSIILREVGWGGYEKMLQVVGERRMQVTYFDGTIEVRMPSQRHEQVAQLLGLERIAEMGRTTPKGQLARAIRDWVRNALIRRSNQREP
jgi:hypothetical protein